MSALGCDIKWSMRHIEQNVLLSPIADLQSGRKGGLLRAANGQKQTIVQFNNEMLSKVDSAVR
jgi:hypothetical protein